MRASIVGSGYVGTTVAACLADLGHEVTTVDVESGRVRSLDPETIEPHLADLDIEVDDE